MAERDAAPARRRAIVVSEYPDVCRAPIRPVPFQTVAYLSDAVGVSPNVRAHGYPATTLRASIPVIHGSPPYTGVKSGTANGPCYPIRNASRTVRINGAQTVRDGTVFGINSASPGQYNTQGPVIYVISNGTAVVRDDGSIDGSMSPPLQLDLRSPDALLQWSENLQIAGGQTLADGGKAVADMARRIQEANERYQLTTRALGTAQVATGGVEAFVGASCVYYTAGVGALLGCSTLAAHGLDNMQAGAGTALSGKYVPTFTYEIMRDGALHLGASEVAANWVGTGADLGISAFTPAAAAKLGALQREQAALRELTHKPPLPRASGAGAGTDGVRVGPRPVHPARSQPGRLGRGQRYGAAYNERSYGLLADLDEDGILHLYIKKGPNTPSGSAMFNEALEQFGSNVKGVQGYWIGGGDLADNFNSFKAAVSAGLSPEAAAFQTFTGKMAQRAGFLTSTIVDNSEHAVVVLFQ
jgi:hypothetical protein